MFRPMRRHGQQLDQELVDKILTEQPRGVLSVIGDDGYPYGIPLNFVFVDNKIYFHCATTGHKLDAIQACDKASFCVLSDGVPEEGSWWYHFDSVIAFGRIKRIDDPDELVLHLRQLAEKYFPADYDIDADMAKNSGRVAMLEFSIEHVTGKHVREK